MTSRSAFGAVLVLSLLGVTAARAGFYNFEYTSYIPDGSVTAYGSFVTDDSFAVSDGYLIATSGSITITDPVNLTSSETLSLLSPSLSTSGNVLLYSPDPLAMFGSIDFLNASHTATLSPFPGGAGLLSLGDSKGEMIGSSAGSLKLEAVPEPPTMTLGLAGVGLAIRRLRRTKRS